MKWFKNHKSEILVGGGALVAGVLSFFITLSVYPSIKNNNLKNNENIKVNEENKIVQSENKVNNEDKIIAKNNVPEIYFEDNNLINGELSNTQDIVEPIKNESNSNEDITHSHEIENVIDEQLNDNDIKNNEEIKVAENTENTNSESSEKLVEAIAINKNEKIEFGLPVSGDVITEFAKDKLVYSETLNEWITHYGVDILSEVASPVKVAYDGVVESVKMDPRYGNTIIVKHKDDYKTIYSNLSTLDLVYVGKKLKQGDIISGVGEGFGFESKEGAHVHYEIIKGNENINPLEY